MNEARPGKGRHNVPIKTELSAKDSDEFVQHLHADDTTSQNHGSCHLAFVAGPLSIDQNIRVDEGGHRALASSRLNA